MHRPGIAISGIAIQLLFLLGVGCSKPEPLKIGFVGGLSGKVADLGVAGRNGATLAIEQANESGGIQGRMLELIVRDDKQDEKVAADVTRELVALKVPAIIGPMTSAMALAMLPVVANTVTLLISPTVTTTDLSHKDDSFLRVISSTTDYASKSALYQYQKLGRRKVVAIYDLNNRAYTENWLRDFRESFEARGGSVVRALGFNSAEKVSFTPLVEELLALRPDSVLIIAGAVDAAMICQQVRKLNSDMPMALSEWGATERLIELGGHATDGLLVAQFLDRGDTTPRFQAFRKAYQKRFGQEPGFAGLAAYDAANVVIAALMRDPEHRQLKQTILATAKFQGAQQEITLDRFGDADRLTFMTSIRNGIYVTLE